MKYVFTALMAVVAVILLAAPATADWDEGDDYKMHYPQMPDVLNGMNVLASTYPLHLAPTIQKVLADDWMCTESGPITDIHIWGSWLEDWFPWPDDPNSTLGADPGNVTFRLSIHDDIKAEDSPTGYSIPKLPAIKEWDFNPGQFKVRLWAENVTEPFFDPNQGLTVGDDYSVWQYNFYIPEADAVWQDEGTIYWLNVTAFPGPLDPAYPDDQPAFFGWKTSYTHEFDDAVYWDSDTGGAGGLPWPGKLIHPDTGGSLDMAFVITPEPGTWAMLIGAGLVGLLAYVRRRKR